MTKGKPWDINEERQLRQLVEEGKTVDAICKIMVKTRDAVAQKMFDLKLKCLKEEKMVCGRTVFSSTSLTLPEDLPNIEEVLKVISAAVKALDSPGLDKTEVLRLDRIISGMKVYKDIFADYLDYRGIEERLSILEKKYDDLDKKGKDA